MIYFFLDFYSVTDTWFVQKCVADMIQDLREYAKNRSSQRPLLVHIATKPTSVAFQVFMNELYGKVSTAIVFESLFQCTIVQFTQNNSQNHEIE